MTKTEELQAADLAVLADEIKHNGRWVGRDGFHAKACIARADALQRIHDRLSAPRAYAERVDVKALKWRDWPGNVSFTAQTEVGEYVVEGDRDRWLVYPVGLHDPVGPMYQTVEDAKAAAQADFEARIRSALSVPEQAKEPGEGMVVTDAMTDAAADAADGYFHIDGDKGPWLEAEGYAAAYRAMIAASPSSASGKEGNPARLQWVGDLSKTPVGDYVILEDGDEDGGPSLFYAEFRTPSNEIHVIKGQNGLWDNAVAAAEADYRQRMSQP